MSDAVFSQNKLTFRQITKSRFFVVLVSMLAVGGLGVLDRMGVAPLCGDARSFDGEVSSGGRKFESGEWA